MSAMRTDRVQHAAAVSSSQAREAGKGLMVTEPVTDGKAFGVQVRFEREEGD